MGISALGVEQSSDYLKEYIQTLACGGFEDILFKYPVISRLLVHTVSCWKENVLKMLDDFSKDKIQINEVYSRNKDIGKIMDVRFDVSNRHNGGRASCVVTFKKNIKLIYKPRSMNVDQKWMDFISTVNQSNPKYPLLCVETLDYTDHGWKRFLESKPLEKREDADAFYFRMGALMGLFYALGGNDFHCEKIVAYGDQPVVTDLDTLLLPKIQPFNSNQKGYSASEKAIEFLSDSVLRLGMLPSFVTESSGKIKDVGSLTGNGGGSFENVPYINGEKLDARNFVESIIEGFHFAYYLFEMNKKVMARAISVFRDCKCRFLIRNSVVYNEMIKRTSYPNFLKDGFYFSLEIERLSLAYLPTKESDVLRDVWPIFCSERDSLLFGDVPLFYSQPGGKALLDSKEVVYNRYFSVSGIMHAKQLIENFGRKNYNLQVNLISSSLDVRQESLCENDLGDDLDYEINLSPEECKQEFLSEAFAIYREILGNRVIGEDGRFTWVSPVNDFRFKRKKFGAVGSNLFDGILGIGVFISMLYSVTKDEVVKEYALDTVEELRASINNDEFPLKQMNLGLANGVSGYVVGLYYMGVYLSDEALINEALCVFNKVSHNMINNEPDFSIIRGCAGVIFAAYLIKDVTTETNVIDIVEKVADRIVNADINQTGFAYGISGLVSSLTKAYVITENEKFLQSAKQMITKENEVYDQGHKNWADEINKKTPKYKVGWESGAPGVGMSRLTVLEIAEDDSVLEQIRNACDFSVNIGNRGTDQLYSGTCGRIDFLLRAGDILNDEKLKDKAVNFAQKMIAYKDSHGHYNLTINSEQNIFNPSLFQGLSGIGYTFLRCAFPEKFSSIIS